MFNFEQLEHRFVISGMLIVDDSPTIRSKIRA
jgi:hypothetical protein